MRIGRAIILPAILTLGLAASTLCGSAVAAAAAHAPASGVHATAAPVSVNTYYHL